jgi:mRNA interferase RelE/StbE
VNLTEARPGLQATATGERSKACAYSSVCGLLEGAARGAASLKIARRAADNRPTMATRLNITYSAYRELETIPQSPLRDIGEAIIGLADDPHPPGSSLLQGIGGCYYLAIDDYYILYHLDDEDGLTVLGVLHGPYHPLH